MEASYLYALLARAYGNNNLPQSSNMCHETTSVGLNTVIGSPVGTIVWADLEKADAFFFGQNPGSNSPRFLHPLQEAKQRGAKIVTFNPIIEKGLVSFVNPQNPFDMLTERETQISDQYLQVKAGGDIAAILGLCKVAVEADDAAVASGSKRVLDVDFIGPHTTGCDEFIASVREAQWADIERESGLVEADLRKAGETYTTAERVIGVYRRLPLEALRTGSETATGNCVPRRSPGQIAVHMRRACPSCRDEVRSRPTRPSRGAAILSC